MQTIRSRPPVRKRQTWLCCRDCVIMCLKLFRSHRRNSAAFTTTSHEHLRLPQYTHTFLETATSWTTQILYHHGLARSSSSATSSSLAFQDDGGPQCPYSKSIEFLGKTE